MIYRCLPAATVAALLLAAPASADSLSITVNVIQAGSASLPSVVFRSGGVITLPTGNDVVAITIGGLTVGGLSGRGHVPRELRTEGPGPKWDTALRDALGLDRGHGFAFGTVGSGVAEDFWGSSNQADEAEEGDGNSGHGRSDAAENAALDRTVVFAGGPGASGHSETNSAAALLLSAAGEGSAVRAALGLLGENGHGNLLALSDEQPIANPEPTSMLLLGTGLAGLAALRRRRSAGQTPVSR